MFSNDGEIPEALAKRKVFVDSLLAKELQFNERDLVSNRDNLLSNRQKRGIEHLKAREFRQLWVICTYSQDLYIIMLILFLGADFHFTKTTTKWIAVFGIMIIAPTSIIIIGRYTIKRSKSITVFEKDVHAGIVKSLSGTVILDKRVHRQNNSDISEKHFLIMNEQEFNLTREAFLRFKHLERYTIYYAPHSKIILSAEPVE